MIQIVRKARNEGIPTGYRGYFNKRQSATGNHLPKQGNVQIQGRYRSVFARLTLNKKGSNFAKKVIPDADTGCAPELAHIRDSVPGSVLNKGSAVALKP